MEPIRNTIHRRLQAIPIETYNKMKYEHGDTMKIVDVITSSSVHQFIGTILNELYKGNGMP